MKNNSVRNLALAAIAITIFALLGSYFYNQFQTPPPMQGISLREELVRPDSQAQGPENAALTIVEFLDPECESCKAFYPTMKKFLEDKKGTVRFVVRYMAFHASSAMAIAAAESAGIQGKYWEYLETLFMTAEEWGHQASPNPVYFEKYASTLGLDLEKFKRDMADPRWLTLIERDKNDGQAMGVKGTPTVFLNGEMLKSLDAAGLEDAAKVHLGGLQL